LLAGVDPPNSALGTLLGPPALAWAIGVLVAGARAWKRDRRWMVNVVTVFGAIDLYTQWFERLGASPSSVLVAGLAALGLAIALKAFNARPSATA